jgi:superfamily II DNA or RNA helicase
VIIIDAPIRARLIGYDQHKEELKSFLTYTDKKVEFELRRVKSHPSARYNPNAQARVKELEAKKTVSLLFEDKSGLWTYSGLAHHIAKRFGDEIQTSFVRPEAKLVPWAKAPVKVARYYQTEAHDALLSKGHAAVEIGTGLGKSFVLLNLAKSLGLKTVVMTPSVSIAEQILAEFKSAFGSKYVGQFFDGKKQSDKLFVISVAQSLARVARDSDHWNNLSATQVFIADESHQCPAKTLSEVCFGLIANAPYRFFFSGTQLRNDGLGMLLDAITGPIVYEMTVQDGVDRGFLAKPVFRMVHVRSKIQYSTDDANDMTRAHVYYNDEVNKKAAELANKFVSMMNRPTVILVDELEQFGQLLPHLRYEARFAHGGVNAANKDKVPKEHHESDPTTLVRQFNAGEFPILVGTSCIVTGTDIQNVKAILYLRGGKSEIEVKQSVGRGTRKPEGKEDCIFLDFCIDNVPMLKRHAEARKAIYQDIYPSYQDIT